MNDFVKYNGGTSPRKIDLNELIKNLINDVESVEQSSIPQGQKTSKYKSLATKFKNALFNDKRKFRGRGLDNRISLKTYSNYLSRTRKLFDKKIHHNFKNEIKKLSQKYTEYSNLFDSWQHAETQQIRIELSELQNKLKRGFILIEKYKPNSKNTSLIKLFPEWETSIKNKTIADDVSRGECLLNDLSKIKINHEIMYHLVMDPNERAAIKIKSDSSLKNKKRSTIIVDYQKYMDKIYNIFSAPDYIFDGLQRKTIAPLVFALAAASGRRTIEIILTGQFKRAGKNAVIFTGQAKKRIEGDSFERKIYTLIDSNLFIKKLKLLRKLPIFDDVREVIQKNLDADRKIRNEKIVINSIFSNHLCDFAKNFFNDDRRVFKDSRSIYARIVYEIYFKTDPRWANVDEDVFFAEILGHDDDETQLHYKQFKLENFDPNYTPVLLENKRLIALQQLDDDMPRLAGRNAAVKIHDWVKSQIEANPDANITTYSIRKSVSVKPTVVARYLEHAANALGLVKNSDTGWLEKKSDESSIIVTSPVDSEGVIDENIATITQHNVEETHADNNDKQPQFTAQQLINGQWLVQYTYKNNAYVWTGIADNIGDAINNAWKNHKK